MGHYKSKSGTGSKMLKLPVLLCVCVTDMYGEYVMLAWVTLGECALYQLVHQRLQHHLQHVTRAVLSPHLWLMTLEDAMRDADCSTENADDETMKLCAQLTFEV